MLSNEPWHWQSPDGHLDWLKFEQMSDLVAAVAESQSETSETKYFHFVCIVYDDKFSTVEIACDWITLQNEKQKYIVKLTKCMIFFVIKFILLDSSWSEKKWPGAAVQFSHLLSTLELQIHFLYFDQTAPMNIFIKRNGVIIVV